MRVRIVGTFDVASLGDLLFPLLADREPGKRLESHEFVRGRDYLRAGEEMWRREADGLLAPSEQRLSRRLRRARPRIVQRMRRVLPRTQVELARASTLAPWRKLGRRPLRNAGFRPSGRRGS
jgi:hypothetical protein